MTKTIWYIHGAYSSSRTFNWLKEQFPEHEVVNINYSSATPVRKVLDQLIENAEREEGEFDVVGHSLGGILAVALSQNSSKVQKVVTMSSPFGGSRTATWLQFLAPGSLFEDIQPFSRLLTDVRNTGTVKPTMSIITTGSASPLMLERNDGVVTVRSQKALKGPKYIETNLSHFEVLLDPDTATNITDFLWS